jgi:AcrR family transcriptional regulator
MPRKTVILKEEIIEASVEIVRTSGPDALNARAVAKALGCSTQPVFSNFRNMQDLMDGVVGRSLELYNDFLKKEFALNQGYPPYKTYGMGYIRFAMEESNLFKLLFMRDRRNEDSSAEEKTFYEVIPLIMKALSLTEGEAEMFHLEMWTFVHGIASMAATSYCSWDMEQASKALTDIYQGLVFRFGQKKMEAENEKRH